MPDAAGNFAVPEDDDDDMQVGPDQNLTEQLEPDATGTAAPPTKDSPSDLQD